MNSQKLEDILNLSLDSTMEEREKSLTLNVGFDGVDRTWELIVKFHGDISRLNDGRIRVEVLLAGYAIVTIPESLIPALTALDEIEYVEKPRELLYQVYAAKRQSCFPPAGDFLGEGAGAFAFGPEGMLGGGTAETSAGSGGLTGAGCLVAVFDSGIDYFLPDFQNREGSRILYLWDQTLMPDEERGFYPPRGFGLGVEFTQERINEAISLGETEGFSKVPSADVSGHGTAVAAIAAGSSTNARYTGAAPGASLLIVKLGQAGSGSYPRTTQLMRAMAYALQKAQELGMPLAVNLSFGNSYGAHDGSSILERFLDNASEVWKNVICAGAGNEGASAGHVSGRLSGERAVELAVGEYESSINVQLWKNFSDRFRITLITPSGQRIDVPVDRVGRISVTVEQTQLLIYVGEPSPYSVNQEIYFDFLPVSSFIAPGIWTFLLEPVYIVAGEFQMYLPGQAVRTDDTRFFNPTPELTLTIPSTAGKLITVGAIQGSYDAYADFSGRGVRGQEQLPGFPNTKPDLAAPGVNIVTARAGGGHEAFTGTSFAVPLVTGAAALLMEWGIVRGNDPYLYGEKLKAFLQRGARGLRGETGYPNDRVGYGSLCVQDSLPD
ncbi:MAG TPA: S8 family serine peptidase [Candidatus Eisenbergiella merdavium]|uniref:S8 family serine peptidase n=1 Tax=Candidatus Eisenbergiella merdavium TaxID=2838551 RepID=A0A9D2NIE9_9FIRM|nr:S8 family serine peptidase [Candidatus Eisenbergiella merdavium]